jgi:hypothetical protein
MKTSYAKIAYQSELAAGFISAPPVDIDPTDQIDESPSLRIWST